MPSTPSTITYASAPPAYSPTAAPAPKYTPKKDFGKAFADLQGRYGFDRAPVLSSKDEKPTSKPKTRTASDSSTESKKDVVNSKKDFSKAFGELQGRYGFDGGAPILSLKDTTPKQRTSSDSSTGSKKSLISTIKSLLPTSPKEPKETKAPKPTRSKYVPPRVPSPARRIIESGPSLSFNAGTRAWTYPLSPVRSSSSSGSSSSSADLRKEEARTEQLSKNAAKQQSTDSAVRGVLAGVYGFDAGSATGRTASA
ncbi:hypothetical protein QFC20_006399 [Naganishia adeliensis]|uniref:Uncharacterized protein n=1 Tax=Naganishia adeliensis TaxID=92952 RepID=A0ACC2VCG6_9TREE|nr:hypothetical protein QFC20_006399 [Naganishia adeliensis]